MERGAWCKELETEEERRGKGVKGRLETEEMEKGERKMPMPI